MESDVRRSQFTMLIISFSIWNALNDLCYYVCRWCEWSHNNTTHATNTATYFPKMLLLCTKLYRINRFAYDLFVWYNDGVQMFDWMRKATYPNEICVIGRRFGLSAAYRLSSVIGSWVKSFFCNLITMHEHWITIYIYIYYTRENSIILDRDLMFEFLSNWTTTAKKHCNGWPNLWTGCRCVSEHDKNQFVYSIQHCIFSLRLSMGEIHTYGLVDFSFSDHVWWLQWNWQNHRKRRECKTDCPIGEDADWRCLRIMQLTTCIRSTDIELAKRYSVAITKATVQKPQPANACEKSA